MNAAQQDADTAQNEAKTYASREVPQARGKGPRSSSRPRLPDQGDRRRHGQAARFSEVYLLQGRPGDQRERIFLETMEKVLGSVNKVIIDQNGTQPGAATAAGVLPVLPLSEFGARARPRPRPDGGRPMKQALRTGLIAVAAIVAIGLYASIFTVGQMQQALVLQFGRVRAVLNATGEEKPGLYFKCRSSRTS